MCTAHDPRLDRAIIAAYNTLTEHPFTFAAPSFRPTRHRIQTRRRPHRRETEDNIRLRYHLAILTQAS